MDSATAPFSAAIRALPAELRLLAACCDPARSAGGLGDTAALVGAVDADVLLELARRHRVLALLDNALHPDQTILPPAQRNTLSERASRARGRFLQKAAEEVWVATAFTKAGVDAVFIKGATLAHLYYAEPSLKASHDIDVLIDRAALADARRLLEALGYRLQFPADVTNDAGIDVWLATVKDSGWKRPGHVALLELHIALTDAVGMLPDLGMASARQDVTIGSARIATFATPELFAYLCVHGTIHGWSRLKWLVDLAALVATDATQIDALFQAAVAAGAGRCPAVALGLCRVLFGTTLTPMVDRAIATDRYVHRLMAHSLDTMRVMAASRDSQTPDTMRQLLRTRRIQYWLAPGIGYRLRTLRGHWRQNYAVSQIGVGGWVRPLHRFLWLPARLVTRGLRTAARSRTGKMRG